MSKTCCKNPKNLFCFVCGLYILSHHKRSIMTRPLLEAYESYFKVRTSKENYLQGPPSVCNVCNNALLRWKNGMCPKPELPFAIPMLWSQPSDHATDCYFCLTRSTPSTGKKRTQPLHQDGPIEYPILRSAIRPKLFATPTSVLPRNMAPVVRRVSVPVESSHYELDEDVSSVSIRTYPSQSVKPKELVANGLRPVVRRSLPPQKIVSGSVGTYPTITTSTLKRKFEPDADGTALTYGMTKVRLRNSEPTIVLEKCKKLLPSNSSSTIISRPVQPSSVNAPRILNVFSLNKDAANCETKPPIPSPETSPLPPQAIVKIEIEDDDDDCVAADDAVAETEDTYDESNVQLDPTTGELRKIEDEVETKIKQEENEPNVVKLEAPKSSPPPSVPALPVPRGKLGFINVKDLAMATTTTGGSTNMLKIKLSSPLDGVSSAPKVVPIAAAATFVKQEPTEIKTPPITPSRYCFINMKDMPSVSANNVERLVKISSPIISGQQSQQMADNNVVKATVVSATTTEQGSNNLPPRMLDQDDGPHRITQSELILLLRELELPKQKSAILIDRLKRWNLLAIEMVGTNRNRTMESPQQQTPATATTSSSSSASSASSSPTVPASSEKVPTLTCMKEIQIRNTRSVNRQSTGPPIITSSTNSRTNTTTVASSKPVSVVPMDQNGGGEPTKTTSLTLSSSSTVLPAVVKSGKVLPPRRPTVATSAGTGSEEKLAVRGTITTRSATGAIVKQTITIPRLK